MLDAASSDTALLRGGIADTKQALNDDREIERPNAGVLRAESRAAR